MAGTITLTIIKPDAVARNFTGPILKMMNEAGFRIAALKYLKLTREQASAFYAIHRDKPFFSGLVEFMSSGPVVAAILEKEEAVAGFRRLIGPTDPSKAPPGTIRNQYAENVQRNAVHGSDSDENAILESDFFFSQLERF